jgi:hypothetical protein
MRDFAGALWLIARGPNPYYSLASPVDAGLRGLRSGLAVCGGTGLK